MPNCQNVSLSVDDFEGMLRFAQVQGVGFTIVGPELPLALGIVDYFQAAESPIFGPTKEGAQIEASKTWAKQLMQEAHIPTAASAATFEWETIFKEPSKGRSLAETDDTAAFISPEYT